MLQKLAIVFCLFAIIISGCTDSKTTDSKGEESENMAKFTKDESFNKAHEEPAQIDFEGNGEMIDFDTPMEKKLELMLYSQKNQLQNSYL